ncbi:MAG: bifunctional aldolase/short-chain dehydrogenase [Gammaproteobacteria bacterium]|nr:bifunctional aldolase/short-chain dehydrogenase [Gammaproteobacteria bacterium]
MHSLWNEMEAAETAGELGLRVYTSRLLGRDDSLVLHGGGNTSLKGLSQNIFGEEIPTLYVKGSGWDLKTIEIAGFSPTCLATLQRMASLDSMSDTEMARELKAALLDPAAPAPSVEAILHAIIPRKFVDHTHADAVVAISNSPGGQQVLEELYAADFLILPYVMPGFILSRQVFEATRQLDWNLLKGIILLHHGVFTFADDARESYENMIACVDRADCYLQERGAGENLRLQAGEFSAADALSLSAIRRQLSTQAGRPMIARLCEEEDCVGYSAREDVADIATRGPLTPDHTLHTKRIPVILERDYSAELEAYVTDYRAWFQRNDSGDLTCLDPAPRVAVWKNRGIVAIAPNAQRAAIVRDIARHTLAAVQWAEAIGVWQAPSEQEIFAVEYWELEQAKLKRLPAPAAFEGRIALVTGAASGIGKVSVQALVEQGCCVIALDINPAVADMSSISVLGMPCDVTESKQVTTALLAGVRRFGGIDILVSNAGAFSPSTEIAALGDEALAAGMQLNFASHASLLRECIPYLKNGCNPAVVLVASKNVPAPGPGAAAYSSAKAALTQLGRVAALELGADGVRVNMLHPNAVYDTAVWTEAVLQQRADSYGLSVEQYKNNNVLRMEVSSADVARAVLALTGDQFLATTGAQIPVDGGNDRVI